MSYDMFFLIKDIIIALLIFGIVWAVLKIRTLKATLDKERRKRSMPLISLEVNTDDDIGVFLINDSYCYARNINIDNLNVIVDYGFKKNITLKFDPLELLKPNQRRRLSYRVFNDETDVTKTDALKILNHFSYAPLEMRLRYENIEGEPFTSTIASVKDQFVIKDVAHLQEQSR